MDSNNMKDNSGKSQKDDDAPLLDNSISCWEDMRMFDNTTVEKNAGKTGSGNETTEAKNDEPEPDNFNVSNWTEMRFYDKTDGKDEITENAGGWYELEQSQMRSEHGNFIKVSHVNEHVNYLCEICQIHSNSRTSLAIHCNGMKHLKKKNDLEKETIDDTTAPPEDDFASKYNSQRNFADRGSVPQENPLLDESRKPLENYPLGIFTRDPEKSRGYSDNLRHRGYSDRSRGRGYRDGSRGRGYSDDPRGRGYSDGPRGRGYNDGRRGRGYSDDPRDRGYSDDPRGRAYSDDPRGNDNRDGPRYRDYSDNPRERSYSQEYSTRGHIRSTRDNYDDYPDSRTDMFNPSNRFESSNDGYKPPSRDRSRSPSRVMEGSRKNYWDNDPKVGSYPYGMETNGKRLPGSPSRTDASREPRLPPLFNMMAMLDEESRSSSPYTNSKNAWSPNTQARQDAVDNVLPGRFRSHDSPKPRALPTEDKLAMFRAPSPPKVNLKQSSRGDSLNQLSKIAILSPEDAKTGVGVVSSVLKSLKNYYQVKANWKAVDLLIDAELKIGSVAALETSLGIKKSASSPKKERRPY